MLFKASAPGSVMLLGEHAVLRGYSAVVCAINCRIDVTLEPRHDDRLIIQSSRLGHHETSLQQLVIVKPFDFILQCISSYLPRLKRGFELTIDSHFSEKMGLGSSAAVTVATLGVIKQFLGDSVDLKTLQLEGLRIIRQVQGLGSGADVAASVYGGVIHYQLANDSERENDKPHIFASNDHSPRMTALPIIPDLHLIYAGYKTPTAIVVRKVNAAADQEPERYAELFKNIHKYAQKGIQAITHQNWDTLGQIFLEHQKLQEQLGVSDEALNELLQQCHTFPSLLGAKISGSGLGDCIIALGQLPPHTFPIDDIQRKKGIIQLSIEITTQGFTA